MTAPAVGAAPCRIFISYRRDDSAGWAGRLASDLQERLGQQTVFQDVATIEAGEDFVAAITRVLQTCAVALVVIGPDWRDMRDEQGARRLENPQDLVRLEIATALSRQGLRVIPVLVGGATMPGAEDLPADLGDLAKRHAFDLSDTRWDYDIGRLAETLAKVAGLEVIGRPARDRRSVSRTMAIAGGVTLIAALGIAMYVLLWRDRSTPPGPLGEFSIDRPTSQQVIPLGAAQTWMLEGRLGAGIAAAGAAPRIEVEVFKLPERRPIEQDGRVRLSTETGFWRFESARFDGAGPYEVIVTVRLDNRQDFKSVEVECLPKSDAFRRTIDADRQRRGVPRVAVGGGPSPGRANGRAGAVLPPRPDVAPENPQARLARQKEELYKLQDQFQDAYIRRRDIDAAERILTATFNAVDPLLPSFPDDTELQNFRAYGLKNRAMILRDRGDTRELARTLAEAEQMFAAIREQAPDDASAWNGLGSIALLRNEPARALEYINRALELRPDYEDAKADRATAIEMRRKQPGR